MGQVLKQSDGGVFIQLEPGKEPLYIGDCVDLDSIPNPRGDRELIQCHNRARDGYTSKGLRKSPPGLITFTLSQLEETTASYLEQVDCEFTLFVLYRTCGLAGVFNNWDRMSIVGPATFTDDTLTNAVHHVDDNEIMHEWAVSAMPPRVDLRTVGVGRLATSEAQNAYFVSACGLKHCGEDCGELVLPCDEFIFGADAAAGTANVDYSLNAGSSISAAAVDPFGASEDVLTGACFEIGRNVTRWFVTRGTDAGDNLEGAYSDNHGASWTLVNIGTTNGEYAPFPQSLFVLDAQHAWICTSTGNVFFSSDGCVTWTDQNASAASGANALNAICFSDENTGFAVGAADTVIKTTDGGDTWTAATATGLGVALQAVWTFSQNRVLVGSAIIAAGSLVMSYTGGTTWEHKSFTGQATEEVQSLHFINAYVGILATQTAGPVGSLHMTADGGHTWKELTVPTNSGINHAVLCTPNAGYAVGQANGGTALVLKING